MNPGLFKKIFPDDVHVFFTDMAVDFILPPDAHELLQEQKQYLSGTLGIDPQKVFTMRQVHGRRVLTVSSGDLPQKGELPQADAMVTNVPGIVLSMRTADCLPVFLFDPLKKCIGVAHAGWKGSALGITAETVRVMSKEFASRPADVLAFFGPAIRPCCYEVGKEFLSSFPAAVNRCGTKLCLDVPLVNREQLLSAGLLEKNIVDCAECMVCAKGYYSFRRDQEKAGRHLSLMTMLS